LPSIDLSKSRRVRGRRYRLGSLLALCLVAVLGGARSLAAIARFAAESNAGLRERLGLTAGTPNASTLGRLLARLDGDALDDAVGAWLAQYTADPVDEPGDRRSLLPVRHSVAARSVGVNRSSRHLRAHPPWQRTPR
jgi:hypothetical protein